MKKRILLVASIVGLFSFLSTMSYAYDTVAIKGNVKGIVTKDCKVVSGKDKTFSWKDKSGCTLAVRYDVKKPECTIRVYTQQNPSHINCPASTMLNTNGEEITVNLNN